MTHSGAWIALAVAALLSHPLLDLCTSYGTQLLAPFSDRRFALDWVAIVDPAVSLILAAGLVVGLRAGATTAAARRAGRAAVSLSSLYLVLGGLLNARIEAIARDELRAKGIADSSVHAFPTLLQLPYRRIVARSGDDVRVGWLSLVRPRPIQWEGFTQARGPLVDAARATPAGRIFDWFAMGEATPRVETRGDEHVVEFDDLRYGFPGCGARRLLGRARRARRRRTAARCGRALRAPAARARLDAARHALARDARVELGRAWRDEADRRDRSERVRRAPPAARRNERGLPGQRPRALGASGGRGARRGWDGGGSRGRARALAKSLEGCEALVHLAQIGSERAGQSYEAVNVGLTGRMLEAARRAGVPRFVMFSGLGVARYGQARRVTSRYFLSKLTAETLAFGSGLDAVVFRPSYVVGPGDGFVPSVLRAMQAGEVERPGDGSYRMQPIAVADAVAAVLAAIARPEAAFPTVFDLVGPEAVAYARLLERLEAAARSLGRSLRLRVREIAVAEADRRARSEAGYQGMGPDELDCLLCDEVAEPAPLETLLGRRSRSPRRRARRRRARDGRGRVKLPGTRRRRAIAEADVAVVGAGVPALVTALELCRRGASVIVAGAHAADTPAHGLGLALLGPGRPYLSVAGAIGRPAARLVWAAGCENQLRLKAFVDAAGPGLGYRASGSFLLARTRAEAEALAESEDMLRDDGFPGEFLDHYMLETRFDVRGFPAAYWAAGDAELDLDALLAAAYEAARDAGVVFRPGGVRAVHEESSGVRVELEAGSLRVLTAVVATDSGAAELLPEIAPQVQRAGSARVTLSPLAGADAAARAANGGRARRLAGAGHERAARRDACAPRRGGAAAAHGSRRAASLRARLGEPVRGGDGRRGGRPAAGGSAAGSAARRGLRLLRSSGGLRVRGGALGGGLARQRDRSHARRAARHARRRSRCRTFERRRPSQ